MIIAQNLTRRFDQTLAVDDVSFNISAGTITGFLGPNGAGKTTTVRMLTGMLAPTSGGATVAGFDVRDQPTEVKRRIGYVPETGALYDVLSPNEHLDFIGNLYHLDAPTIARRAGELIELFGIGEYADQRISALSKGTRQKVLIASALIHRPEVLFLDEPLHGLDVSSAMIVKEFMRQYVTLGKAVFFCSHILEVVEKICDTVIIINRGRVVAQGTAAEITRGCGAGSFEEAFSRLTGGANAGDIARDFIDALEQ